jgi:hypothetical protein
MSLALNRQRLDVCCAAITRKAGGAFRYSTSRSRYPPAKSTSLQKPALRSGGCVYQDEQPARYRGTPGFSDNDCMVFV